MDGTMLEGLTGEEHQKFSALIKILKEELDKKDNLTRNVMDITIDN